MQSDTSGMKTLMDKPGMTLLVVGFVLVFLIRPLIGGVWVVGGVLSPLSFAFGVFSIVGGVYLLARQKFGPAA